MILDYFRGNPREVQSGVLKLIESYWKQYDVFVVNCPVASGKSKIALCIADWIGSARISTPTNILVSQYKKDAPDLAYIKSSYNYECDRWGKCAFSKRKYCSDCPYLADYKEARNADKTVSTMHMLLALRKRTKVQIFDEGHNLPKVVADLGAKGFWPHKLGLALSGLNDFDYLLKWSAALSKTDKQARFIHDNLSSSSPEYIFTFTQEFFSGGGWAYEKKVKKGEPTLLPYLKAIPINLTNQPNTLYSSPKLVLLSATIGRKDLEAIGLDKKRVIYLEGKSPIPPEQRKVLKDYIGRFNYQNSDDLIKPLAEKLIELKDRYKGQKGLVHMTYSLAQKIKPLLGSDFLFHTPTTTSEVLERFKRSKNKIFVASGLYEGVSLDEDLSRWQAICKVPWPSLSNPGVKFKSEQDSEYYIWETIKPLLQASGRIVRTPSDWGTTHILDSSFESILENKHLLPEWFLESVGNSGC